MLQCCAMMCGGICSASFLLRDDHCLLPFLNQIKPPMNNCCWKWKPICKVKAHLHASVKTCLDVLNLLLEVETPNSGIKTRGLECVLLTLLVEIWSSVVMAPLKLQRHTGYHRVSAMAKFSSQQLQGAACCDRCSGSIHFILSWRFLQPLVLVYLGHLVSRCNKQQIDLLMICSFETSWAFYLISRFWRRALVS